MKVLRDILGIVVLVLTLLFAATAGAAALYKLGQLPAVPRLGTYTETFQTAPWWLIGVCGAVALFLLFSALSLMRSTRQALLPYLAGLISMGALWWYACQQPQHGQDIALVGREAEFGMLAAFVVLAVLVWLTDRRKRYRPGAE